eukprot:3038800-Pleurochrysis_carterae.AAC.1
MKNENDKIVKDPTRSAEERSVAQFKRTSAKLMLNSLLGRNSMKLRRTQHLLTRSVNDIITLTNDDVAYSNVRIEDIECGPRAAGRIVQNFTSTTTQIASFLAPNATLLYTDTDSLTFSCTPQVWAEYKKRHVPLEKTLGGMDVENEAEFVRFVSVRSKKYAKVRAD